MVGTTDFGGSMMVGGGVLGFTAGGGATFTTVGIKGSSTVSFPLIKLMILGDKKNRIKSVPAIKSALVVFEPFCLRSS
ncbi:hypothetical protein D3C71_1667970 [compost metagenome]